MEAVVKGKRNVGKRMLVKMIFGENLFSELAKKSLHIRVSGPGFDFMIQD